MEPRTQVEIQLGHMCNNRCVFCVSGQETELKRARPLAADPILERLREAAARGHKKLTILGGEPTLQPAFPAVVRSAVELGFEEIVIFTNGVKTARESFVDEVIALAGDRLTWRLSLQGATREAHERTTRRPGSFGRLEDTLSHLAARGQRITVNMCVVRSNYESVPEFPALLGRHGVRQLHLDMVRPLDAGTRTEAEFAEMIPRYSDLATPLRAMIAGFPPDFDVNIGNLPYCIAPDLAPFIHHDGEATETVAIDGESLSRPWDKYFVKRRDKRQLPSCASCVFRARCSGIFDKYREIHGDTEFVPVSVEALGAADPTRRIAALHWSDTLAALAASDDAAWRSVTTTVTSDLSARVELELPRGGSLAFTLAPPGAGVAGFARFALRLDALPLDRREVRTALDALVARLAELGEVATHPPGDDALPGAVTPLVTRRLARLRHAAPFLGVRWTGVRASEGGRRAELDFEADDGGRAVVWLLETSGKVRGGYDVRGQATPDLRRGIAATMAVLSTQAPRDAASPTTAQK